MILGAHRQALLAQRQTRSPRHRPAFQDAVEFQPQIVMQPSRRVLLHHEGAAGTRTGARGRFGRAGEIALARIGAEIILVRAIG